MMEGESLVIFISHSSRDSAVVASIREHLRAMAIEPYTFDHDVRPGEFLATKLQDAIQRSAAVLVLLTAAGVASPYVQQEVGYAIAHGKPLIPLVEPGLPKGALAMLEGFEYVTLDPGNPDGSLTQLTRVLRRLRDRHQQGMQDAALADAAAQRNRELAILALAFVGLLLIVALAASEA